MLKLNAEDEKALYNGTGALEGPEDALSSSEKKQMESLLPLTERVRQSPYMIEKWENALLVAGTDMEDMEKRLKVNIGIVTGCIGFSLALMLIIIFMKLDSAYVMLATGLILVLMTIAVVFMFFCLRWILVCGIHKEWKPFQNYIRKHGIVTLKYEMDTLLHGIQQMKIDNERAKEDIRRIQKQDWLSPKELKWAEACMQIPEPPKHTVNLAEDLWKWKEE